MGFASLRYLNLPRALGGCRARACMRARAATLDDAFQPQDWGKGGSHERTGQCSSHQGKGGQGFAKAERQVSSGQRRGLLALHRYPILKVLRYNHGHGGRGGGGPHSGGQRTEPPPWDAKTLLEQANTWNIVKRWPKVFLRGDELVFDYHVLLREGVSDPQLKDFLGVAFGSIQHLLNWLEGIDGSGEDLGLIPQLTRA